MTTPSRPRRLRTRIAAKRRRPSPTTGGEVPTRTLVDLETESLVTIRRRGSARVLGRVDPPPQGRPR